VFIVNVLIVKNNRHEGPGLIRTVLEEREILYDTVELDSGNKIPDISPYSAIFVLGGPDSVNNPTSKVKSEIIAVREILMAGIPYFGVCLGMQVLVKAAGGKITACPRKEIGWRDEDREFFRVFLTDPGKNDPLCSGLPGVFPIFQLHSEMAVPSIAGEVLAFGDKCPVQIVKEGRLAYGIQGHLELTEDLLTTWLSTDADLSRLNKKNVISDYKEIEEEYVNIGKCIISNFLDSVEKE
jgi:GMP synthase-like glutamine amidotransferase